MERPRRIGRWNVALLLGIGAIVGANTINPAVAHVTGSIKHLAKHIDKRFVSEEEGAAFLDQAEGDASFLDQGEADDRYVNTDEKAGDAETLDGLDSSQLVASCEQPGGEGALAWTRFSTSSPTYELADEFFNCTDQNVEVRRASTGVYRVRFLGLNSDPASSSTTRRYVLSIAAEGDDNYETYTYVDDDPIGEVNIDVRVLDENGALENVLEVSVVVFANPEVETF